MLEKQTEEMRQRRGKKLYMLYILFVILIAIFLFSVFRTITSGRHMPSSVSTIHDRSLRGEIISKDGYTVSSSQKRYRASVYAAAIKPEKKDLFLKLFSIYSGLDEAELSREFYDKNGKEKRGRVILSSKLNARSAIQLKSLARKLRKLNVFRSIVNHRGENVLYGLDIVESAEARRFPLKDCLSPVVGYVRKKPTKDYTRLKGMKGLERYAEKHLTFRKNGLFEGKRDVVGAVIRNGNSTKITRVDGLDLHLNIPLSLQRYVEMILDEMKHSTDAQEIIAAVMESTTGKVLAMASSERYDPSHIRQQDTSALNPKFSEYPYEVGSVMKPLTLSIALEHKLVTPDTWFDTFNGAMKISKRRTIHDDEKFESMTATDIIVHSSNVGISLISWKLTGQEFREGLLKFGLSQRSGIDLSRDLPGKIKSVRLLNNKTHRANQAYGYGMHATFAQMLKAYSAFNNDGKAMTPRIIDYFQDKNGKIYRLPPPQPDRQAISKKTAHQIHDVLVQVVKRGTGIAGQYRGLETGGKTGTAHIATAAGYTRLYHSSFYGFANDNSGHKYTIGVLVIKPKKPYKYFASQSAVPTFKKITQALVDLSYLKPELTAEELAQDRQKEAERERKEAEREACARANEKRRAVQRTRRSFEDKRSTTKPYIQRTFKTKPIKPAKPAKPAKSIKQSHEFFNDLDIF